MYVTTGDEADLLRRMNTNEADLADLLRRMQKATMLVTGSNLADYVFR